MSRERIIFEGDPDNLVLAARAAKFLLARPTRKDAILAYGEGAGEIVLYVRRNKASLSVYQDTNSSAISSTEHNPIEKIEGRQS